MSAFLDSELRMRMSAKPVGQSLVCMTAYEPDFYFMTSMMSSKQPIFFVQSAQRFTIQKNGGMCQIVEHAFLHMFDGLQVLHDKSETE